MKSFLQWEKWTRVAVVNRSVWVSLTLALALIAGVLAAPATAAGPNLLTNGSFETGSLSSWSLLSGDVDIVSGWQATDGTRSLDLNGFQPASISQSFSTVSGQTYELLYDLAGNPGSQQTVTLEVAVAGQTVNYTFNTAGKTETNMGWVPKSLTFTATGGSTTLRFTSLTTGPLCLNGQYAACGPALDNIRVFQLNGPPTVGANNLTVTVNEGGTATNTGSYSDPDAANNVTITASTGTVTKTGTNSGTWSWSHAATDGPSDYDVTITANDGTSPSVSTTFHVHVNNVAPNLGVNVGATNSVYYVDWTAANPAGGTASGHISLPNGSQVNLTFEAKTPSGAPAPFLGAQTSGGFNYWASRPAPYISAEVPNAPPNSDILQLSGGNATIYTVTLSQPIVDPIMAILSLGSPPNTITYNFNSPFTIVSEGVGHWGGCADACLQQLPGNILQGTEGHGTLKFLGTFTSFSWTVPKNENWHGFTFAIRTTGQLGNTSVDEGDTATNSGDWSDVPADIVTLSASVGTVVKDANGPGTWAWSLNTSDGPTQSQTVSITAADEDGGTTTKTFPLVVRNVAPTITAVTNSGPVNAGQSATITVTATDPAGPNDPFSYAFDCDNNGSFEVGPQASNTASCTFAAVGNFTVKVKVADGDGGEAVDSTIVTASNVAPTVTLNGPASANEGETKTYTFTVNDTPGDTFTVSAGYPSCGSSGTLVAGSLTTTATGGSFICTFPDGPGNPTIAIQVTDGLGTASNVATLQAVVNNVAPTVTLNGPATVDEGQSAAYTFTITDPGQDTFTINGLVNGSFEQPAIGFGSFAVFPTIPGWTTTFGCGIEIQNHVAGNPAPGAGDQFAELDSHCRSGVAQTMPTQAGETYTLSYLYTPRPGVGNNNIEVWWNGTLLATRSGSGIGQGVQWQQFTHTVTATGATTMLEFRDTSASDSLGGYLDNVSLNVAVLPTCGAGGVLTPGSFTFTGNAGSFQCTFADGPANPTVSLRTGDSDGALSNTATVSVTVNNVAPTVTLNGPASANEGESKTYSFTVSDPGVDTWTVTPSCGTGGSIQSSTGLNAASGSFVCSFPDGPATPTVSAVATDSDGAAGAPASVTVTVANVRPADPVLALSAASISENGSVTVSGNITDPGVQDTFTVVINWGEGAPQSYSYPAGATSFSETHQYLDDNPSTTTADAYAIAVTVTDKDGGVGSAGASVTVNNIAPVITATLSAAAIDENGSATVSGTITDPGSQDTFTVVINWGDGAPETLSLPAGATSYSVSHQYLDDNPTTTAADVYAIAVSVTDDDSGAATAALSVAVNNVAPTVAVTSATIDENSTATAQVTISDTGSQDTFTLAIGWGEGASETHTFAAAGTFSLTHQYLDDNPTNTGSDVYPISVTVTDDDGGVGTAAASVTVNNVAPATVAVAVDPVAISEDGTTALSGSFADPGTQDTFTVVINWGDGSANTTLTLGAGERTFGASHQYLDDNPTGTASDVYAITVTVTDDDGGVGSGATSVTVNNVAPHNVAASSDQPEYWGLPVDFNGSFTDTGTQDTHTVAWDFGDGGAAATMAASHAYANPGTYTATLTVTDDDTGATIATTPVEIRKRETTLAYTGTTTAPFGFGWTLAAQLTDAVVPGTNIAGRTVTFTVASQTFTTTTNAAGQVSTAGLPLLLPGTYPISLAFAGDSHYIGSTAQSTITIVNTADAKVTGGGLSSSAGGRGGFNVQTDANGSPKGELQWQVGNGRTAVSFHAPTMTALAVSADGTKAWVAGVGRDGKAFVAYVEDHGEPGRTDVFSLWVDGVLQTEGVVSGGNIQIHK